MAPPPDEQRSTAGFGLGTSSHQPPIVRFFDEELPPEELEKRPLNWWSIGSLIGGVCCVPGFGLIGTVLGAVGIGWHRRRLRDDAPPPRLTLLSYFGIVIGLIMTLLWLGVLVPSIAIDNRMEAVKQFSRMTMIDLARGDDVSAAFTDDAYADALKATAFWQQHGTIAGGSVRNEPGVDLQTGGNVNLSQIVPRIYNGPWDDDVQLTFLDPAGKRLRADVDVIIELTDDGFLVTRLDWKPELRGLDGNPSVPPRPSASTQPSRPGRTPIRSREP
ncbi:MAG: hypothetical protein AAGK78_01225 [Planctomycetota bacterium]